MHRFELTSKLCVVSSCVCKTLVNGNGGGNCTRTSRHFAGKRYCYVQLPSNCKDLIESNNIIGEKMSAEACSNGVFDSSINIIIIIIKDYKSKKFHFLNFS